MIKFFLFNISFLMNKYYKAHKSFNSGFGREFELLSKNVYIFNLSTKKFIK